MTNPLPRRLGLADAIVIGLGSMIGAGVFSVFAPAAAAAGAGLLIGLGIAAIVAFLNAAASAQLAAQYPTSGGTYVYGREQLGEWSGYFAGWSFVVGKTASCAAMGLTFAAYVTPLPWQKVAAVGAVCVLAAVNYFGVTKTTTLTKIFVVGVLAVLGVVVVAAAVSGEGDPARLSAGAAEIGWYGVVQSAGLLFFAFAGYARVATMGEEVRSPRQTIPRAIVIALGLTLIVYAMIAIASLAVLGPERLAQATAPMAEVAGIGGWNWTGPIVGAGAAIATLGALLTLIAGLSRTGLAMARNDDLPRWLAAVQPRYGVPHHGVLTVAVTASALILLTDVRVAIGFSSFGVLLYYLVTNLAAYRQDTDHRRYPRPLQIIGAAGCLLLVAALPWQSIVGGIATLAIGIAYRAIRLRLTRR